MEKPLSLKEKLELKKLQAAGKAPPSEADKVEAKKAVASVSSSTVVAAATAQAIKEAPPSNVVAITEDVPHGVVDLRPKIAELAALSGEDLTNAMKELKAALMQNPSAVELMLPEDIGEMVAALRKITGQEIVAAASKPKKGTKTPAKTLSKEEMMAAFDEL